MKMNQDTTKNLADIMLAYADGKEIEFREIGSNVWHDLTEIPTWNWQKYEYRIKPKEITVEDLQHAIEELTCRINELETKLSDHILSHPSIITSPRPWTTPAPWQPFEPSVTYGTYETINCNGICSACEQRLDCSMYGGHKIPIRMTTTSTTSYSTRDDFQMTC